VLAQWTRTGLNGKFYGQCTIFVFKEQFHKTLGLLAIIFTLPENEPNYELKIAA
jgi:hypothetical protein